MQTPWGPLELLNLDDHETCRRILSADKHQITEGLVVEHLLDQILEEISVSSDNRAAFLDIETVIIRKTRGPDAGWLALVWPRSRTAGLGRYLQYLGRQCRTFVLEFQERRFLAREHAAGQWQGDEWVELPVLMEQLAGHGPSRFEVDASVRDVTRQQQSFWGYLSQQYGEELGTRIALTRILFNCGVQPWFRNVWNVDRVMLDGDVLWHFEIKHKFPYGKGTLRFGINKGELGMLDMLGRCGFRGLHTILVKPVWSKDEGSMYLLNSLQQRRQAALIAAELTPEIIAGMLAGQRLTSASHTTLSGKERLSFYELPATSFTRVGTLADDARHLADGLATLLHGGTGSRVTDAWLRSMRVA